MRCDVVNSASAMKWCETQGAASSTGQALAAETSMLDFVFSLREAALAYFARDDDLLHLRSDKFPRLAHDISVEHDEVRLEAWLQLAQLALAARGVGGTQRGQTQRVEKRQALLSLLALLRKRRPLWLRGAYLESPSQSPWHPVTGRAAG